MADFTTLSTGTALQSSFPDLRQKGTAPTGISILMVSSKYIPHLPAMNL
jgi:hypothetical protein